MAYRGTIIELDDVTIIRDNVTVLEDVSWKVTGGQNWFIMGSNGSGKTSLLEAITGYLWPRKGIVRVLGEIYGHTFIPDIRKRIGYVSPWVFDHIHGALPVRDVVVSGKDASMGFRNVRNGKESMEVRRALDMFEARHLSERRFGELSSGEAFRVIMARAMVNSPDILILDEPFSHLDMGTRLHLYDRLDLISNETVSSVVLVTHHTEDIRPLFTHGLLLKDSKVFDSGRREDMLDRNKLAELFGISADML
jgi:iron complex transport system ATP-binding protein